MKLKMGILCLLKKMCKQKVLISLIKRVYNEDVCAEAIQTILRRESYQNPYESLKDLTRTNSHITQESLSLFINGLDVSEEIKEELRRISPFNYTGI